MKIVRAATLTLFVHSFAGWFYIAENAVFHPQTLAMPLTHLLSWPREDTFGIICFGVSIVSLFVWRMLDEDTYKYKKGYRPPFEKRIWEQKE